MFLHVMEEGVLPYISNLNLMSPLKVLAQIAWGKRVVCICIIPRPGLHVRRCLSCENTVCIHHGCGRRVSWLLAVNGEFVS